MLHTPFCDLVGIDRPVVSAPMGGTAGAALAAAVSNAGGLGLIGGTNPYGPEWLRDQIRWVRERTDRPFGVGFISSFPDAERLMVLCLEEGVRILSHSFADPTPFLEPAHQAGALVLIQVQSLAQALQAAAAGADVIAIQGTEAGGHTGHAPTFPLVPAVVDAVAPLPVLAAGGIADGRGLAAALMLGAQGVWMGTRFVASEEWLGHPDIKRRLVDAGPDDTVLTKVYDIVQQLPFPEEIGDRVLRNRFTDEWVGRESELAAQREAVAPAVMQASMAGNPEVAAVRAGHAVGLIRSIEPASEIVRRIVEEAEHLLVTLPREFIRPA